MKTRFISRERSSDGHALLMVLCITTASLIMLAATMNRTMGTSSMNARNNQYIVGLYAAEAATEKVFGMMKTDFLAGNLVSRSEEHTSELQSLFLARISSSMNARNNQYIVGLYAAEAATEKVFGMMKTDFLAGNLVS